MKPREILSRERDCIEQHAPACQAGCPLHIDCRAVNALLRQGETAAAWQTFAKDALLPRLLASACSGPCGDFCREKTGRPPVSMPAIERWLLRQVAAGQPLTVQPYMRLSQKAAVIGGGAAGLAAAVFLYEKGFSVTVIDQDTALGGSLRRDPRIDAALLREETDFFAAHCHLRLGCRVGRDMALTDLEREFDAVLLAVGQNQVREVCGWDLSYDPETLQANAYPWLFCLSRRGDWPADSPWQSLAGRLARGKQGGISADRFLKKVSLTASRWRAGSYDSELPFTPPAEATEQPFAPGTLSPQEEAARCLDCHCRECTLHCHVLRKYGKAPRQYIREVANNLIITRGRRNANAIINSCTLCGLCGQVCVNGLDMGEIFLAARENMVEKDAMPPRAHDFPLRDMQFSLSEQFDMWREDPAGGCGYLFFPGCQLAAGAPQYIAPLYRHLRKIAPAGVGLALSCCGAPAYWAGQRQTAEEVRANIEAQWRRLGSPVMITGCTTCYQELATFLPEEKLLPLWQALDRWGLPPQAASLQGKSFSLHDPCTARHMTACQDSVRRIAAALSGQVREMAHNRDMALCCGYGGLAIFGNPQLTGELQVQRLQEAQGDMLTYCWMCRDYLAQASAKYGMEIQVYHMLDLLFGGGQAAPVLDISEKRAARRRLKQQLLQEFWQEGENAPEGEDWRRYRLQPGVAEKMAERLILLEDVAAVIDAAESSGRKLLRPGDGHYFAHLRRGLVTYWVEYGKEEDGYTVYTAYCHRLQILPETPAAKK
ncbi:MAG: NAD(P)-binding protein [Firmicutes bacterium]|nr:NAD(P)-binding protein [Bacillota bacterium]